MKLTELQESRAEDIAEYLRDISEHPECEVFHKAVVRRAIEREMYEGPHDIPTNIAMLDTEEGFTEVIEHDISGGFVFAQMYDEVARKIAATEQGDGYSDEQLPEAALKALDVVYPLAQKRGIE